MEDKIKKRVSIGNVKLSSYVETLPIETYGGGNSYIRWGEDNMYPDFLYNLYRQCATLGSIINISTNMTLGKGILDNSGMPDENRYGDSIGDIVKKITLDRWIFGGFSLQIIYNKLGDIIEVCYLDIRRVRLSRDKAIVYVSDEVRQYSHIQRYGKYKVFNPNTGAEDGIQILYYKGSRTRGIYPIPDYEASITDAETQIEIKRYNFNEINNNFLSSGIFNFNNGVPEEEEQKDIEKKVNERFGGAKNAARILCVFNENADNALSIDRIGSDDLPDRYANISEQIMKNIFISLGAHPQLFGMAVSTGFAQIEYSQALELYSMTQLEPIRNEIERALSKIWGVKLIRFIPYQQENTVDNNPEDGMISDGNIYSQKNK